MHGIGKVSALPRSAMKDRVDVFQRVRTAGADRKFVDQETMIEQEARASIATSNSFGLASLLGPGTVSAGSTTIYMDPSPEILPGYVLQVSGTQIRYNVKSVARYPNPHRPRFQVVDCILDQNLGHQ